MLNISQYSDLQTASTSPTIARQRAENLSILGAKKILELCVGPSLKILEQEYNRFGIDVYGNDIDPRWKSFYPKGKWIIGDCFNIDKSSFDAIVFAPPLSKGCSGKREDSLSIDQVVPNYNNFLNLPAPITALVLPGRTLSTKSDRNQFHKLLSKINYKYHIVPLKEKVVKYIDIYIVR